MEQTSLSTHDHTDNYTSSSMAVDDLIVDPALRPLLQTSQATLAQTLSIVTWLSENYAEQPALEAQLELSQQQKTLFAYLSKLRGQNRRAAFGARTTKQETAEARQEVDRLLLQLQNLYYEQRHLMGEISACEGYDHAYMRLPLLSVEEYLSLFPEHVGMSEEEIMPLRIEHERREREKMEQQRLELVTVKDGLVKENARRREELRKMDEKLETLIDELKPLGETLEKDI